MSGVYNGNGGYLMDCLLKNANVYVDNEFIKTDVFIKDGIIVSVDGSFPNMESVVSFYFSRFYRCSCSSERTGFFA